MKWLENLKSGLAEGVAEFKAAANDDSPTDPEEFRRTSAAFWRVIGVVALVLLMIFMPEIMRPAEALGAFILDPIRNFFGNPR